MHGIPTRYIIFDTETNVVDDSAEWVEADLRFRLGVAKVYDPVTLGSPLPVYYDFDRVPQFHAVIYGLTYSKEPVWIFAHNAGFDLRIVGLFAEICEDRYTLFNPLAKRGKGKVEMPLCVLSNPPLIIKAYRPDGQQLMFCDTYQWINLPLRAIGDNLGMAKGQMPPEDAPLTEWYDYCRRDVDVLDLAMRNIWEWLKRNGIPQFHPTRAGQSRLIYRTKYEKKRITYAESDEQVVLDRLGYYGGRTDLWFVGRKQGPIYQLDVNSLYPHVMRDQWYPCAILSQDLDLGFEGGPGKHDLKGVTAEVLLNSPDAAYPVKCRDGTIYCKGKVRTILCGPELVRAHERGHIQRFGRWTSYKMSRLFKEFVDDYWAMRCEAKAAGDKTSDLVVKLLMNSLYGKFGQRTGDWVYHDRGAGKHEFGERLVLRDGDTAEVMARIIAGHVFYRTREDEARGSFIPIAAYVTSYARCLMDQLRAIAGLDHVFYQATDSLYVDQTGFDRLKKAGRIDNSKLGGLKLEDTYDQVVFRNIHNMDKGSKRVRGSVKAKAREIATDKFVVVNWENFSTALIRGNIGHVRLTKMIKQLNPRYKRQIVHPDGTTSPFAIDNWALSPEDQRTKPLNILR